MVALALLVYTPGKRYEIFRRLLLQSVQFTIPVFVLLQERALNPFPIIYHQVNPGGLQINGADGAPCQPAIAPTERMPVRSMLSTTYPTFALRKYKQVHFHSILN